MTSSLPSTQATAASGRVPGLRARPAPTTFCGSPEGPLVNRRSVGFPLALGITLCVIAALLGVGWQLIVVGDLGPVTAGLSRLHWLLIILGSVFFVLIIVGLLLLCLWLVREIRFNQRQQAFLDAVTHEMKTPIAALKLYLETLLRHDPEEARRRGFLERMAEDVERLEHTVTQVLAAARSDAPAETRPGVPIDLTELLQRFGDDARRRHGLPEEAIRIDRKRPLTALGDAAELGVVFRNLLENAVKYSDRRPCDVRGVPAHERRRRAGAWPRSRTAASASSRRELRKIFQRFYRAGRDMQRQAGLGLGLFIVRTLVRRNGGDVEAESAGTGRGSRFRVILPAAPGAAAVAAGVGARPSRSPPDDAHPGGRGRGPPGRGAGVQPRGRGLRGGGRGRRCARGDPRERDARARPDDPRPDAARHGRLRGGAADPRGGQLPAHPDAHREGRPGRPGAGASRRAPTTT